MLQGSEEFPYVRRPFLMQNLAVNVFIAALTLLQVGLVGSTAEFIAVSGRLISWEHVLLEYRRIEIALL